MKTAVIVPNWNGETYLRECIDSLLAQSVDTTVVVVENGSVDSSRSILETYGDKIVTIYKKTNLGFAGGVNTGIRYAIDNGFDAIALFNNDAVADKYWLENLVKASDATVGIITGCLQSIDGQTIDSTGDQLTVWGLPYPRGRGSKVKENPYTVQSFVFGASGGASLYSVAMLREIELFDEDFFAYYEDVDISFRAQLAGWKVMYEPSAIAYHHIGATSSKIKGFTVYQTFKNLPWLVVKNVPHGLLWTVFPRFKLAYASFFVSAVARGQGLTALQGMLASLFLMPKKLGERRHIQSSKKVSAEYILSILTHDLPENSRKLRTLRNKYWKLKGEKI